MQTQIQHPSGWLSQRDAQNQNRKLNGGPCFAYASIGFDLCGMAAVQSGYLDQFCNPKKQATTLA